MAANARRHRRPSRDIISAAINLPRRTNSHTSSSIEGAASVSKRGVNELLTLRRHSRVFIPVLDRAPGRHPQPREPIQFSLNLRKRRGKRISNCRAPPGVFFAPRCYRYPRVGILRRCGRPLEQRRKSAAWSWDMGLFKLAIVGALGVRFAVRQRTTGDALQSRGPRRQWTHHVLRAQRRNLHPRPEPGASSRKKPQFAAGLAYDTAVEQASPTRAATAKARSQANRRIKSTARALMARRSSQKLQPGDLQPAWAARLCQSSGQAHRPPRHDGGPLKSARSR